MLCRRFIICATRLATLTVFLEDGNLRRIPVTYGIREEIYCLGEQRRKAFGIVSYSDADDDGTAIVTASVGDVTDDREALEELVRKCNELQLDPIHLEDVVEDFLC